MYVVKIPRSKFYQLVYFVEGKRTTVSTKTSDINEAYKFLGSFKINAKEQPQEEISFISLSEFKNEYLEFVNPTKSKKYVSSIALSFRMLINFTGDIQLNKLDLRTLDKFITHTFARTPRGASLYYRTLKAAFSKAVLWNYIPENPLKKIKLHKVAKTFPIFITEEELQFILSKTQEEVLRNLFFTAFYTGMRLGELVNMKWSWIDLKQNQITVKCSEKFTTKSKKERIIPINQNLKTVLTNCSPKIFGITDNYVFSKICGVKLNDDYITKKFKRAVRVSKLNDKVHFHTLRHSFASLLVQRGVSLYVVKELLGHEELTTTQIYSHLQQQNLRDAVNLL